MKKLKDIYERCHVKIGSSIICLKNNRKTSDSPEMKQIEIKIHNMNIENRKKIKPLTFKF